MRHGKADYNKRFEDGGFVEVHGQLSHTGMMQVKLSAEDIKSDLDDKKITIVTSPKRRCFQTADLLIEALQDNFTVNIIIDKGFGDVGILTRSKERPLGSYAVWETNLSNDETWYDGWIRCKEFFPGEEDVLTLKNRVNTSFGKLLTNKTYLIVCHEEVMMAIADLLDLPQQRPGYAEVWKIEPVESSSISR
jgi:broad specificity phosphatase PhoE